MSSGLRFRHWSASNAVLVDRMWPHRMQQPSQSVSFSNFLPVALWYSRLVIGLTRRRPELCAMWGARNTTGATAAECTSKFIFALSILDAFMNRWTRRCLIGFVPYLIHLTGLPMLRRYMRFCSVLLPSVHDNLCQ